MLILCQECHIPDIVIRVKSFAAWLIEQREARGWTQAMLADRAGVRRSDVNAIEHGRIALPGAEKRRRLAEALGLRHVDVLVGAGELAPDEVSSVGQGGVRYREGSLQARALELVKVLPDDRLDVVVDFMEASQRQAKRRRGNHSRSNSGPLKQEA
jgi:transcriptional regulator with XRE-family HTH domain